MASSSTTAVDRLRSSTSTRCCPPRRARPASRSTDVADRLPGIFETHDLVGPEDAALQEMARSMRRHS
jgi:hypothetical protein